MFIFVIDIGTSSMRGILYDQNAHILMKHQIITRSNYLSNGYVEQDAMSWQSGLVQLLKSLSQYCQEHHLLPDAISLTAQRSSVIPVSKNGTPLAPAIMWQDKRTLIYEKTLQNYNDFVFSKAGSRINPVFSACKMLWIREHEPELYQKSHKLITIPDYLIWLMTENFVSDHTYGSRSLLMNLEKRQWDENLLRIFRIEENKLCKLISPGSICGTLTPSLAAFVGLESGIPIISAGGDQQCAALGLGVLKSGQAEITTGTGAFLLAGLNKLPTTLKPDIILSASAIPNRYLLESSVLTCCSAFDWFHRTFYPDVTQDYSIINREISNSSLTPILALPFFQGRATPDWNSHAQASFHRVTLSASRGDFARAILEGICYEISINLAHIGNYIKPITSISICGGLTKNPIFPQMEADILQQPMRLFSNEESTSLGAWIQAAVTLGLFQDYDTAFQKSRFYDSCTIFTPDISNRSFYQEKLSAFKNLYHKLYC